MIDEAHYESGNLKIDRVKDNIKYLIKGDVNMDDISRIEYLKNKKRLNIMDLEELENLIKENNYADDEMIHFKMEYGTPDELIKEFKESIKLWEERIAEEYEREKERIEKEKKKAEQRKRYLEDLKKINYDADVNKDQMDIFSFI